MARAPKATETTEEKQEGAAPESKTTSTDNGDKGTEATAAPVKDPDQPAPEGSVDTGNAEADALRIENERLAGDLNLANDRITELEEQVRVAGVNAKEAAEAPNPLAAQLQQANDKIDELNKQIDELLNAEQEAAPDQPDLELGATEGRNRLARGYLLAVVLGMPENYRLNGLAAKLDELEQFVVNFEGEDRYIAVELIKGIAEHRPNDIPSGRYMTDVRKAFAILDGESENTITGVQLRDEQAAAYSRLSQVVGGNPVPAGFIPDEPKRSEQPEPVLDGTEEQNAAARRFARAAG